MRVYEYRVHAVDRVRPRTCRATECEQIVSGVPRTRGVDDRVDVSWRYRGVDVVGEWPNRLIPERVKKAAAARNPDEQYEERRLTCEPYAT